MLSVTNSIPDIKVVLRQGFAAFGFADEAAYTSEISRILNEIEIQRMRPTIGDADYDDIQAKDKTDLDRFEENTYWGEVYFTASNMVTGQARIENFDTKGEGISIAAEGYSKTVRGGSSAESTESSARTLGKNARKFMAAAGFKLLSLRRGGGFAERDIQFQDEVLRSHFNS